jgi:hypothetical protein
MEEADTVQSVMQVLKTSTLPDNPAEIDLRFFRRIYLADTYNGVGSCTDGVEYSAILYGNKVVHESAIYRDYNNMRHNQRLPGNELYYQMFEVAQKYLEIPEICRVKYFEEKLEKYTERDNWDCIFLTPKVLQTLEVHPQYRKIKIDFGLTLKKVGDIFSYQVECSKRYKTTA